MGNSALVADVVDLYFRIRMFQGSTRPFIYGIYITLCRNVHRKYLSRSSIAALQRCSCGCSLTEAGNSVIVASMPTAAKVWRRHIVDSFLYNSIRSRMPASTSEPPQDMPSDLRLAKAKIHEQKRRRGQYSVATLLASLQPQTHRTGGTELGTTSKTELTMVREFRESLDQRFAQRDEFSVYLDNPSKSQRSSENV